MQSHAAMNLNYPFAIQSIANIHPILENNPNFNILLFQGMHTAIVDGDQVNPLAVMQAERTVELLSVAQSEYMSFSIPLSYIWQFG